MRLAVSQSLNSQYVQPSPMLKLEKGSIVAKTVSLFPSQRDGASIVFFEVVDPLTGIRQRSIVLFGGDRFKMSYSDLYRFYF